MLGVFVVEDDPMLRDFLVKEVEGLSHLVNLEIHFASTVGNSVLKLKHWTPDILILDLSLPDGSGVTIAERYAQINPDGKILILTGQVDFHQISESSLSGMLFAILNKSGGLEPLRKALWDLVSNASSQTPDLSKLSERQLEMLRLIGEGFDTFEIAERMGITFATAQTHRRQITGRLGVKGSRLMALAKSLPLGV